MAAFIERLGSDPAFAVAVVCGAYVVGNVIALAAIITIELTNRGKP